MCCYRQGHSFVINRRFAPPTASVIGKVDDAPACYDWRSNKLPSLEVLCLHIWLKVESSNSKKIIDRPLIGPHPTDVAILTDPSLFGLLSKLLHFNRMTTGPSKTTRQAMDHNCRLMQQVHPPDVQSAELSTA